jgi:hypothetical protein
MTFAGREQSRQRGEPFVLYYFRYGTHANSFHAFTDAEAPIVAPGSFEFEPVTYTPEAIERSAITSSGTLDKASLNIVVPRDNPLAGLFVAYPPSQVVTAIIRQGHLGATEYPVAWSGRVVAMKFDGSAAELSCEPVATSMRRNGLRRHYQYGCPHVLYGDDCKASKAAATVSRTIAGALANRIFMPSEWNAAPPVKYIGGLVEWQTAAGNVELRTILWIDNETELVLNGPATGAFTGVTVHVSLGCNRHMNDCELLHDNIQNFGGQPWIPLVHPLGFRSHFY